MAGGRVVAGKSQPALATITAVGVLGAFRASAAVEAALAPRTV